MPHAGDESMPVINPFDAMNDLEVEAAFFESLSDEQRPLVARYHRVGREVPGTSDTFWDMSSLIALSQEHLCLFSPDQQDIILELSNRRAKQAWAEIPNES